MFQFLKDNIATIVIATIVIGLMVWVVVHKIRQSKKGVGGCSSCPGCGETSSCHK